MRRLLYAAAAVVFLLAAFAPPAQAAAQWCEVDPEVTITTPRGNTIVVHVTNYGLGVENLGAVESATVSYTVRPGNSGGSARGTDVKIFVLIPRGPGGNAFDTRSVVSTGLNGTGTVLATGGGVSGRLLTLEFGLNVP